MSNLARKSVEKPVLVFVVFALLGIVSLFSLRNIPISLYPNIDEPILTVVAYYESAGPESVEKSVTKVLEQALTGLNNLKKIKSTSAEGLCTIELEFRYGANLDKISSDVRDKISEVSSELPKGVKTPSVFKFSGDSMPIMTIAIRGNRSADDLKKIAEDVVVNRMKQAAGISQVSVWGGRKKIVRAEISQNRLEAYGLTMTGVSSALAAQNLDLAGGRITDGSKEFIVRTLGEFRDIASINGAVVGNKNGYAVRLSDIGSATMGYKDTSSMVYVNGQPGVYLSVNKQSGTNTVNVANSAIEMLNEIKKAVPDDVQFEILSDSSQQVRATIDSLFKSAIEGAALAMLVLLLFLRNARSTVIMGVSIPFSILITLLSMKLAGITLDMMTMTGLILGVGMIVDASVVILENIHQYRERGMKPTVAAMIGTQEMFFAVLSGGLTTICVFIPIVFFKGELGFVGMMLPGLIFTIIISLSSSLFVGLFLVPVLASHFIPIRTREEKPLINQVLIKLDRIIGAAIDACTDAYRRALSAVLRNRWKTVGVAMALMLASLACVGILNVKLMPESPETSVILKGKMPVGTKLATTDSIMRQWEATARKEIKGYKTIITNAGGEGDFFGSTRYSGTLQIDLPAEGMMIDTADSIKDKLRAHFKDYPSAQFSFSRGEMDAIQGADIDIALYVDDVDKGLATARKIVETMKKSVPEVTDIAVDMTSGLPQIGVEIDRERAYAMGVDVSGIAREINACIDGVTATVFHDGGKDYDVILMLRQEDRGSVPDIDRIFAMGTSGPVALANFARATKSFGPVAINRENQTRVMHVTATISAAMRADEVERKIQKAMSDSIVLPDGVSVGFAGSWNNVQKTGKTFILIIVMALLLVYGVMAGIYGSFLDPFINMFTIPFGLIGVVAIHLLTGNSVSMFTAFGLVMLVGIAVNNGIILVDQTNLLVARGQAVREACLFAAVSRLRPILMTTLTTLMGMAPMAFLASDNSEMMKPIGLSVFGGLLSSTLVTLFLIPALYSLMHEREKGKRSLSLQEAQNAQG
jgi:hydrophobic/amphiphilic exporter-1 (mainly G- bacteria), HAE1 family